jgi:gliding motility-associated lipoprotein GldH
MKAKLFLFALVFVVMSCIKNKVFDEFNRDFTDNRWESKEVKSFEFENMQSEEFCELKLHFGHISGFQFKEVPLEVEISTPDGKVETLQVVMKLIDEDGKDIGDCSGDICDVFQTIKTFDTLEKGIYKVAVKSKFEGPYLPNVLGVGIVVEKQK